MTVDDMIDWLESAKRISAQSGQEIGNYPVILHPGDIESWGRVDFASPAGLRVDHGASVLYVTKEGV